MDGTVTVVGAGAWGTAIARLLAGSGLATTMWALEPDVVDQIERDHENRRFLPGVALPPALHATNDLDDAIGGADIVVSAVPTQHVRSVFDGRAGAFADARMLVSVSKGIEVDSLLTPTAILAEVLADAPVSERLVALSGPSFAREVAMDHPTAVVAASRSTDDARSVRDLFSTGSFRVYSTDDIVSVELGGALKNVIAIAAGISHGLGFAQNTKSALITRGLAEIMRVGVARGGTPITFAGLSGVGDLVLTCSGDLSRNRTVGRAIGEGRTLREVIAETDTVAEGVKTTVAARRLASGLGIEMPITEQVFQVLHEDKPPARALEDLMGRVLRDERES